MARVPLSVLDLAPVVMGSTAREALANSTDLVRRAEALGYTRYWVAEHHNMPGIASSQPAVLLAHLGNHSSTIRLGSGGVMLPNHSPLVVAEQFGMLEALHPGRIDLGIGRAPGTDQVTAAALRRGDPARAAEEFPQSFRQLMAYFDGEHPQIRAVPAKGYKPQIWMLGSSDFGAQVAALLGLPFSFAHHFAAANTEPALHIYKEHFTPSDEFLSESYASIGVSVVCAETEERARYLAKPGELSFIRLRTGKPARFASPEEAAEYQFSPLERELLRGRESSVVIGDPVSVVAQLDDLVARTGVQELIVTTTLYDHDDRVRSYELLAQEWGLSEAAGVKPQNDAV
ncbi:MAG TPA: LLM class flavin-dependent oxidoreductase [Acidimicrobiales bacterium]|jgi:luciferase family oxidoreductase group 1|nr:LLM class flavin-dependent oxidoreductase [Acidimicrobiales bacterium]